MLEKMPGLPRHFYKYNMKWILFIVVLMLGALAPTFIKAETQTLVISSDFGIFDEGDEIVFYGEITNSAALNLLEVLGSKNSQRLVMISPGGYMPAALIIGNYIRQSGIAVIIREETQCMSACAYAAMASQNLDVRGELLFHSPYFPTVSTESSLYDLFVMSNIANLSMIEWFIANGYTTEFYSIILENTSTNTFISFDSTEDLYRFKNLDPLHTTESPEQYYNTITLE